MNTKKHWFALAGYIFASILFIYILDTFPTWHLPYSQKIKILLGAIIIWGATLGVALALLPWRRRCKNPGVTTKVTTMICAALALSFSFTSTASAVLAPVDCATPWASWPPPSAAPMTPPPQLTAPDYGGTSYKVYSVTNAGTVIDFTLQGKKLYANGDLIGIVQTNGIVAQPNGQPMATSEGYQLKVTNSAGIPKLISIDKNGNPLPDCLICFVLIVAAVAGYIIWKLWKFCDAHLNNTNNATNSSESPALVQNLQSQTAGSIVVMTSLEPETESPLSTADSQPYTNYISSYETIGINDLCNYATNNPGGVDGFDEQDTADPAVVSTATGLSPDNYAAISNALSTAFSADVPHYHYDTNGFPRTDSMWNHDWLGNCIYYATVVTNAYLFSTDMKTWSQGGTYTIGYVGNPAQNPFVWAQNSTITAVTYDRTDNSAFMTNWYFVNPDNSLTRAFSRAGLPPSLGQPPRLFIKPQAQ
jgi:hypothetical protein